MGCFDWQPHVKQKNKRVLNQIHLTVKSEVFPWLFRQFTSVLDELKIAMTHFWKTLLLIKCYMIIMRSIPCVADLTDYRWQPGALVLQHCLTSYLIHGLSVQYQVLRYPGNTAIMFASAFTSHSRPPKKLSFCHHTQSRHITKSIVRLI